MTTRRTSVHDVVVGSVDDEPFDVLDADSSDLAGLDLVKVGVEMRALVDGLDAVERRKRLVAAESARRSAMTSFLGKSASPRKPRAELQAELRQLAQRGGQTMLQQYQMKFEAASDDDLVRMIAEAKHALGED